VLACNAGHGSEVVLADLLTDDDPARPDFHPEMFCQLEHRAGDPAFERKEATGCNHRVCFAQAFSKKLDQRFVELRMFFCKGLERGAAEQLNVASRTATTDAERGSPSMIESSPTMSPRPTKARMRSSPERETIVTLRSPSSMR